MAGDIGNDIGCPETLTASLESEMIGRDKSSQQMVNSHQCQF